MRYARRSRRVGIVLVLVAVVSTFAFNFNVLLPVLAGETLDAGPEVFGILSATFGAGALVGALLSATIARASLRLLLLGTAGFGLAERACARADARRGGGVSIRGRSLFHRLARKRECVAPASRTRCDPRTRARAVLLCLPRLSADRWILSGWLAHAGGTALAFAVGGAVTLVATGVAFVKLGEMPRWRLAHTFTRT